MMYSEKTLDTCATACYAANPHLPQHKVDAMGREWTLNWFFLKQNVRKVKYIGV